MALNQTYIGSGLLVFLMLSVIGLSCAILAITNRELYNAWTVCAETPSSTECYAAAKTCWISDAPLSDIDPCSYLYAVGALGLFFPMLAGTAACLFDTFIGTLAFGVTGALCNFAWWIVAAIYFQLKINDINDLSFPVPQGDYRKDVLIMMWVNMGVSFVMLLIAMYMAKLAKHARDERRKERHEDKDVKGLPEAKMVVQADAA